MVIDGDRNFLVGGLTAMGSSAASAFGIPNGTAPSTSPADMFQMYSADVSAGVAAPHFRTEPGDIIKLYKVSTGWSITNLTTDRSYNANSTTIDEIADVLGTLIEDLKNTGVIAS
jgi:hypothetical protein